MRSTIYLLVVGALCCFMISCQGDGSSTGGAKHALTAGGSTGVELKPLDDPDNPYKSLYREWDQWIYAHAVTGPVAWQNDDEPENWTHCTTRVDDEGWMVPALEYARDREEATKAGSYDEFCEEVFYLAAEGEMSPELLDQMQQEEWLIRAQYYPEIPAWLGENPSKCAMFVPDGRFVTYGPVGSHLSAQEPDEDEGWCCGSRGYYLYDEDGNKLAQNDCAWFYLFYGEDREWPKGECTSRQDGYFVFHDRLTDQILEIYDYDGTLLDSKTLPPKRDMHNFQMVPAYFVTQLYKAQQALK